ncbi:MAG: NPCBM/NEW2 domain-containing protein [Planctomycetes bacterium]|nr:NPCBM/NEW2 domain-containing protein [Planctomycetota bacterium]
MKQGWGRPQIDKSITGKPLRIAGQTFATGVGSHADSVLRVRLDGQATRFTAWVGVDDGADGHGSIVVLVYGDGKHLFHSGVMKCGEPAKRVDVDLSGTNVALLACTSAGDGINWDHVDWAEAEFHMLGDTRPRAVGPPREERVILTPKPRPEPKINGPKVYGARPGRPFIYRIPCTGQRPLAFAAEQLPESLELDRETGIITGTVPQKRGEYAITLRARNPHGQAARPFKLIIGDTLALTPPMGWNSWYIHYDHVTEAHMRAAADTMIASGMADYGYQYVNIDDCWMKKRGDEPYRAADGTLLTNDKFPDIGGMVDHIHSKGLRAGTYISPGPWTCAGYVGSYQHEQADARQFAQWGFDFLKYDWCTYEQVATGAGLERLQRPYRQMSAILKTLKRDIVLNLCQYGLGEVWTWGGTVGGHCWRTTDDLGNQPGALLPGFYDIGLSNARHWQYAKPGQWNDPDYILIGWVSNSSSLGEGQPTTLTPNEQYSYMSMWCLMAAPLVFSGDMAKLDEFTLNVLCNAEVIDVDQDPLGQQARIVTQTDELLILAKPLEDGTLAVGLFNLGEAERPITVKWDDLGLSGKWVARDPWRQVDLGTFEGQFEASVARHGVALVRLRPAG